MKVNVREVFQKDGFDVTFYERIGGEEGIRVFYLDDDRNWRVVRVTTPEAVEPSLFLPRPMIDALMDEVAEIMPPSEAQGRHLDDAIGIRDRLLALVEQDHPRRLDVGIAGEIGTVS